MISTRGVSLRDVQAIIVEFYQRIFATRKARGVFKLGEIRLQSAPYPIHFSAVKTSWFNDLRREFPPAFRPGIKGEKFILNLTQIR
jgi:hypothetical protein